MNDEAISVPLVWVGAEDVPILFANNFVVQHEQNEFVLTIGQVTPPMLLGTEEERREQAKKVAYVPVKVVARLAFTRQRLVALIQVLTTNLQNYDLKQTEQKQ